MNIIVLVISRFDKIEMKKALEMLAMHPDIMLSTTDNQIPSNETSKEKTK